MASPRWLLPVSIGLCLLLSSSLPSSQQAAARFVRQAAWAGRGTWLKADLHMHSTFSDGTISPDALVAKAAQYGCQVVALTDHADRNLRAATPEYSAAIAGVRETHPDLIVFAGLEWNVPPRGGDEHANVLVAPGPDEGRVLSEFKARFDDYHREPHDAALADEALRWLAANANAGGVPPVVIDNHPSRKDVGSLDNVPDMRHWRSVNDLVIGFEGGPGHQRGVPLGAYEKTEKTIDRWDPAVARVGDAWDQLLLEGLDVHAALASSDFHSNPDGLNDPWPCQFSETWLFVPEKTTRGVIQALRAGLFFADHGHIVRNVEFVVEAAGLPRAAWAGETIEVAEGTAVTTRLRMDVPERDWQGQPNRIDAIELIALSGGSARIVANRPPTPGRAAFEERLTVPRGGLVLRARGRRVVPGGPDQLFYTNPIRIRAVPTK